MNIFKEEYSVDDKLVYKLYTADVWAVSLGREVRVVIVDYLDTDKRTQARKVFFSTDLTLPARDIFDIYRTRFQLEFVFRDAKQFTGLTHCQARNKEALAFAFNASLSSVNVARAYARQQGHNLSVGSTKTLLHNAAMVDRFIAMSAKHANLLCILTILTPILMMLTPSKRAGLSKSSPCLLANRQRGSYKVIAFSFS